MTFTFKLGYQLFQKVMKSFQNFGLPSLVKSLVYIISLIDYDCQRNLSDIEYEIYSNSFKAFYGCLSFNYNITFYEYETDSGMSESTYIMVKNFFSQIYFILYLYF